MLGILKLSVLLPYTENDHFVVWGGEGEFWEWKTDENGSPLCPVLRFDVAVGSSDSIIIHLVQHSYYNNVKVGVYSQTLKMPTFMF
jgi:hypothetical protein